MRHFLKMTLGEIIHRTLSRWFKISLILIALYIAYSLHTLVEDFETVGQRFLDFTLFIHNEMVEHDKPPGSPDERPGMSS
jgi:4-hydroxybenzoate polyprenyltransferase